MAPLRPRIKICCIASLAEAELAIAGGAAVLGLVSQMPSGPGVVPDDGIARILHGLATQPGPPRVQTFLLTALQTADALAELHRRLPASHLQLVDAVPHAELRRLRVLCPAVQLVQVIHVINEGSVAEALALTPAGADPLVDMLLLDSGNPHAAVKELGGTGRAHDWRLSRRIVQISPLPVWLAGGLSAANVGDAIRQVHPYGLDLCSSVRTGVRRVADAEGSPSSGHLDALRLHDFMAAVRRSASEESFNGNIQ
jgi:phosphoribosylanthranilate isomerase